MTPFMWKKFKVHRSQCHKMQKGGSYMNINSKKIKFNGNIT